MNEQARKPEREAVLCTSWKHEELCRNDITAIYKIISKWLISNRLDNNDPCMLRHTAGCSFKGKTSFKSSLIDLEAWDYAIAA